MTGLLVKTLREVWLTTLLFAIGMFLFQVLVNLVLPQIQDEIGRIWLQMPFLRTLITALLGTDLGDTFTSQVTQAIVWVHPVVLTIIWAHEIVLCTRVPAGEVDRGTIDVLLGLPVARWTVFGVETIVWLGTGVVVLVVAMAGFAVGSRLAGPEQRPDTGRVLIVVANLFAVYVAVGGGGMLVSALSDRRGRAIGVVFATVVASFLLTFLAGFWAPAERVAFLSVLDYYQPAEILRNGAWPLRDMGILLGFGALMWGTAGWTFARRSLCTT